MSEVKGRKDDHPGREAYSRVYIIQQDEEEGVRSRGIYSRVILYGWNKAN